MIVEILKRTPPWVWLLLCFLFVYGYTQTRSRIVSYRRAMILPAIMLALSLSGLAGRFDKAPAVGVAWFAGVGCALVLNRWLGWPWGVRYSESERSFALTGSWFPLILMLCIFSLRYFANVSLALNLGFTRSELFSPVLAWVYGLLGGIFLSGSVCLWQLAHPNTEPTYAASPPS